MSYLEIKNKKAGAELNLISDEDFTGIKTFYIAKDKNKNAEYIVDLLSRFDNDKITFLSKEKVEPILPQRFPRIFLHFYELHKVGIIKLFVSDMFFNFSSRKNPHDMYDYESAMLYFSAFSEMSHKPYVH